MIYAVAAFAFGQVLPRFELAYVAQNLGISVSSAQAGLSAAASGMMALTGVVFALAFIMVQFSAVAYSPRLVRMFIGDQTLYHSIGVFSFTFIFAFFTLAWVDRNGSGKVSELFHPDSWNSADGQHVPLRQDDSACDRFANRTRAALHRRQGPRGD